MKTNLTKTKGITKDNHGCEFPYTILTVWKYSNIRAKYNQIIERIYISDWWDLKASSLNELKAKVSKL